MADDHAPSGAPSAGPTRAAFAFIFVTVLLDMLALGIIVPVLPKLVIEFEGGDTGRAALYYGLFMTVWAGMQFLCSPLLGAISDRYGRRPVILLSTLGLALDYGIMAAAPTLGWLFVGRALSGVTSASYATAYAYIADVTEKKKRAGYYGMLGAAFGIGFVLGPAVGGLLGSVNLRLPFWVAGGVSLVGFLYGAFVLPESLPPERRSEGIAFREANPWG
ncbi:MAG TPA: MFS transporter, partial [Longimicrobiales bacterium]|nr:MFS transporter [Longimicrobiales bacterium]